MPESGADRSYSEHVYRVLLLAYPKEYRREYGPQMEQAFRDLRREALRRGGIGLARLWVRVGLDLASSAAVERSEDKEIAMRDRKYRSIVGVALATALILLIPLLAFPAWSLFDFVFAGTLIFGTGLTYVLVARRAGNVAYLLAFGIALAAAFLLIILNGAVGIIGSEDNEANLMYVGVLGVGIIGAIIARFRPHGMARALFVMALGQALVALIAVIYGLGSPWSGPVELVALNGFFVALFLGSAWLFRNAARWQTPAGAEPEG
jgi:hypothetical protein